MSIRTADLIAPQILGGFDQFGAALTRGLLERSRIQEGRADRQDDITRREAELAERREREDDAAGRQAALQAYQMGYGGVPQAPQPPRAAGGTRAAGAGTAQTGPVLWDDVVESLDDDLYRAAKHMFPMQNWSELSAAEWKQVRDSVPTRQQRREDMTAMQQGVPEAPQFDPNRAHAFANLLHERAPEHLEAFLALMQTDPAAADEIAEEMLPEAPMPPPATAVPHSPEDDAAMQEIVVDTARRQMPDVAAEISENMGAVEDARTKRGGVDPNREARVLAELSRVAGFPIGPDLRRIGPDYDDTMADAVRHADAAVMRAGGIPDPIRDELPRFMDALREGGRVPTRAERAEMRRRGIPPQDSVPAWFNIQAPRFGQPQ